MSENVRRNKTKRWKKEKSTRKLQQREKKYGEVILEKPSNPLITRNPSNSKP